MFCELMASIDPKFDLKGREVTHSGLMWHVCARKIVRELFLVEELDWRVHGSHGNFRLESFGLRAEILEIGQIGDTSNCDAAYMQAVDRFSNWHRQPAISFKSNPGHPHARLGSPQTGSAGSPTTTVVIANIKLLPKKESNEKKK